MVIRCNQHNVQGKKVNSLIVRSLVDMRLGHIGFEKSGQRTGHNCLEKLIYRMLSYNLVGMIRENKQFERRSLFDLQNTLEKKVFG